ncbi:hypothetical protein C8A01DRAFT_15105 [Parachaetomium inaequale]|uniref:Uncharacterized protein n=1 Tax=Parachaetomium inaequale TaxID=2588326 RepID=A0AAN6PHT1_9PEZI|nr:hypothetical protein C8A01DRAFT_15105 [Parachaetomium inaequale]
MSALQRELAKSKIIPSRKNEDSDNDDDWRAERWKAAKKAMADGTFKDPPPNRFPVILTPNGPVSSASHLLQLAELDSLPETIETTQIEHDGTEVGAVTICHVSFDEMRKLEERAEVSDGIADGIYVLFRGKRRYAATVKALKEGITLEEVGSEKSAAVDE